MSLFLNCRTMLLVGLLGANLVCFQANADESELALDPEIQAKVLLHVRAVRPKNPLTSYASTQELDHKMNFTKKYVDQRSNLTVLENGLIGSAGSVNHRSGEASGAGRAITLCGLVPLVAESSSTTESSVGTVLPIGNIFVPFGIKTNTDFNNRVKLVSLEASISSLCNPQPGVEFTYKTETEVVIKTSGVFSRTTRVKRTEAASCKTAAATKPASELLPSLQGTYLPVSCDVTLTNGAIRHIEYAFLIDSAFYLTAESTTELQRTKIQYTEASYIQP